MGVASNGLDENRPHHGFTIIVGDEKLLQTCGKAGFNPFSGHNLRVITEFGEENEEILDTMRRNAFHGDGAIVVDGLSGRVVASGWFVSDISQGGTVGGARSRSAAAIATQANKCYVVKASEDSHGALTLHLGEQTTTINGRVADRLPVKSVQ